MRRAQRLDLLRHDIPSLPETPGERVDALSSSGAGSSSAGSSGAGSSSGPTLGQLEALVDARVQALVPAIVEARLSALRAELATLTAANPAADSAAPSADTASPASTPASTPAASSSTTVRTAPSATPAPQAPVPAAAEAQKPSPTATSPAVRVVQRNEISGEAALRTASASLARRAPAPSTQPSMAPRCLAHASQHYLGATEDDVVAAWQAMRERFRLTPETKIQPRRALLEWLQRSRNVCTSNIHWYGDFFAVRSCPVRLPEDHPGHGVDGWLIGFDPNGETFLRAPMFAEAFESPSHAQMGAVPKLVKPAWVSEARRAEAAARRGGEASRPFSPETADDLYAQDFFRGLAD